MRLTDSDILGRGDELRGSEVWITRMTEERSVGSGEVRADSEFRRLTRCHSDSLDDLRKSEELLDSLVGELVRARLNRGRSSGGESAREKRHMLGLVLADLLHFRVGCV